MIRLYHDSKSSLYHGSFRIPLRTCFMISGMELWMVVYTLRLEYHIPVRFPRLKSTIHVVQCGLTVHWVYWIVLLMRQSSAYNLTLHGCNSPRKDVDEDNSGKIWNISSCPGVPESPSIHAWWDFFLFIHCTYNTATDSLSWVWSSAEWLYCSQFEMCLYFGSHVSAFASKSMQELL